MRLMITYKCMYIIILIVCLLYHLCPIFLSTDKQIVVCCSILNSCSDTLFALIVHYWFRFRCDLFDWMIHKTKRHRSMKIERRYSVTFQSPFSRLNCWYISGTIQSPFSAIQSPSHRLSLLFIFLLSVFNWSNTHYFLIYLTIYPIG